MNENTIDIEIGADDLDAIGVASDGATSITSLRDNWFLHITLTAGAVDLIANHLEHYRMDGGEEA